MGGRPVLARGERSETSSSLKSSQMITSPGGLEAPRQKAMEMEKKFKHENFGNAECSTGAPGATNINHHDVQRVSKDEYVGAARGMRVAGNSIMRSLEDTAVAQAAAEEPFINDYLTEELLTEEKKRKGKAKKQGPKDPESEKLTAETKPMKLGTWLHGEGANFELQRVGIQRSFDELNGPDGATGKSKQNAVSAQQLAVRAAVAACGKEFEQKIQAAEGDAAALFKLKADMALTQKDFAKNDMVINLRKAVSSHRE